MAYLTRVSVKSLHSRLHEHDSSFNGFSSDFRILLYKMLSNIRFFYVLIRELLLHIFLSSRDGRLQEEFGYHFPPFGIRRKSFVPMMSLASRKLLDLL